MSVDFIGKLPVAHGFNAIMACVDSISKQAHFIPTYTRVDAPGTATLYRDHVWKLHGLPDEVLTDWGPQFASVMLKELYQMLGIKCALTTSYHPQSDGQTKWINQEIERFLRIFCNHLQDDWDQLLALAEFSYNNLVHSTTQSTPFMLDTGRNPCMSFEPLEAPATDEAAGEFASRMKAAVEEAKAAISKAQEEYALYCNRRRTLAPIFVKGDRVFLDSADISTDCPLQKLGNLRYRPFEVEEKVGPASYQLKLPHQMRHLHPVFPVVKLTPAPEDPFSGRWQPTPPLPVVVEGKEEYEVEEILNAHYFRRRLQYLVKWQGHGNKDNEWVSANDVHAPEALQAFYQRHPNAVRVVRSDRPWHMRFEDALNTGVTRTFVQWKPASVDTRPWRGGDVRGHFYFYPAGHYTLSKGLVPSTRTLSLLWSSNFLCKARPLLRSSFAD
jgi:hypothetical protein